MLGVYSCSRSSWRRVPLATLLPFTHVQSDRRTLPFTACCLVTTGINDSVFLYPWKIWDVPESGNTPNMLSGLKVCWLSTGCVCATTPKNLFLGRRCMNIIVLITEISSQVTQHIFSRKAIVWFDILFNGVTFIQCPNMFRVAVREHELKLDDSCPCAPSNDSVTQQGTVMRNHIENTAETRHF